MLKISDKLPLEGVAPLLCAGITAYSPLRRWEVGKGYKVAGSLIGGLPETQEMLDYCTEHNIVSDVEVIRMDYINEAYERMLKGDVKYRFFIDMKTL